MFIHFLRVTARVGAEGEQRLKTQSLKQVSEPGIQ